MWVHSFWIGISLIFFETASNVLFLLNFSSEQLPYIFIGISFVIPLVGWGYAKLRDRFTFAHYLTANLAILLVSICGIRLVLSGFDSKWPSLFMVIWSEALIVLTGNEFWGLAGRLFNVRQGKRLFGLIGSGKIVAMSLGSMTIPALVGWFGVRNLLIFSAAGMGLCLVLLIGITRICRETLTPSKPDSEKRVHASQEKSSENRSLVNLAKNRYVLLIFSLSALSAFAFYFIDYCYLSQVKSRFPSEAEMARFFGIFNAVNGMAQLAVNIFLSGFLINRYGLGIGLMAVPILGAACLGTAALFGSLLGIAFLIFWPIIMTRLVDDVFGGSLFEPSLHILYQPLSPARRTETQSAVDCAVEPIAGGVAGVTLLVCAAILSLAIHPIIILTLLILGGWAAAASLMRREYTQALTRALNKRALSEVTLSLDDASSVEVLKKGLESSHPGEVLYSLNLLAEIDHESLETNLVHFLEHTSPEVRQYVLQRIEQLGLVSTMNAVKKRVKEENVSLVRELAIRTLCALGETDMVEQISPYLEDSDPNVRKGAMVGLLRYGGIEGILFAGEDLIKRVNASDPSERIFAAQVLGEVGVAGFYRPLLRLLRDSDPGVLRAALAAAAKLKSPRLWPLVMERLPVPSMRALAASALAAGGDAVIPELEKAFEQWNPERDIRKHVAALCGRIHGEKAVAFLKNRIRYPNVGIRHAIWAALAHYRYQALGEEANAIRELIHDEMAAVVWTLSTLSDLGDDENTNWLRRSLHYEFERCRERIFFLLSFIYPYESIHNAQINLECGSAEKRSYALEIIDSLLSQELKEILVPLLESLSLEQRLKNLERRFLRQSKSRNERLRESLERSPAWTSSWTKVCALYAIGLAADKEFHPEVETSLTSVVPLMRETAVWAMMRLQPENPVELFQPLTQDGSRPVADMARYALRSCGWSEEVV